jgi:hypothetical protein
MGIALLWTRTWHRTGQDSFCDVEIEATLSTRITLSLFQLPVTPVCAEAIVLRLRAPPDVASFCGGDSTALCRLSMPCCCSCNCSFWAGDLCM